MAAVKLHHRLVVALIHVMDDPDRMRPNSVPNAIKSGDQNKPARPDRRRIAATPSRSR
jgi:hypothetical protein